MKTAISEREAPKFEDQLRAATAKAISAEEAARAEKEKARLAKRGFKEARKAYKEAKKSAKKALKRAARAQEELKSCWERRARLAQRAGLEKSDPAAEAAPGKVPRRKTRLAKPAKALAALNGQRPAANVAGQSAPADERVNPMIQLPPTKE
jgi:hypothetical protein